MSKSNHPVIMNDFKTEGCVAKFLALTGNVTVFRFVRS